MSIHHIDLYKCSTAISRVFDRAVCGMAAAVRGVRSLLPSLQMDSPVLSYTGTFISTSIRQNFRKHAGTPSERTLPALSCASRSCVAAAPHRRV